MPYFMRYVTREEHNLSYEHLEHGLKHHDPAYRLQAFPDADTQCVSFYFGDDCLGTLSICKHIEPPFKNSLNFLRDRLSSCDGDPMDVTNLLSKALALVVVQVAWGDREAEETLELLEPLWSFLFCRWDGLLQSDDEGWQDAFGLVLAVN